MCVRCFSLFLWLLVGRPLCLGVCVFSAVAGRGCPAMHESELATTTRVTKGTGKTSSTSRVRKFESSAPCVCEWELASNIQP